MSGASVRNRHRHRRHAQLDRRHDGGVRSSNFGGTTRVTGQATISGGQGHQLYYGRTLQIDGSATWTTVGDQHDRPDDDRQPGGVDPAIATAGVGGCHVQRPGQRQPRSPAVGSPRSRVTTSSPVPARPFVQADWLNSGLTRVTGGHLAATLNGNVTNTGIFEANGGTLDVRGGTFFTNLEPGDQHADGRHLQRVRQQHVPGDQRQHRDQTRPPCCWTVRTRTR